MRTVFVDILLVAGVIVLLLCAAGVLVMRSAYDRLHYASAAGWGAALIAASILVHNSLSLIANKALATAFVLLVCGPVLGHVTARALRIRERGAWNVRSGERPGAGERRS
ncbi:MAG TPA: monovalent cation/H(+) antiporter subunit G [Solirubrobacteraceae bacterium]|nr:monovalent cation/H(+) antiporter subunit G [Solirubrobacteraceae bacterium]